ncbi:MAG TPA: hypothetical protein VGH28_15100 [Polyangiaceae bacterium]|jgi:hypothetical protein
MPITNDTTWKNDAAALRGYEDISTTSAMGKIAQDANGGKPSALLHGGDKTYDELVAEYKSTGGGKAELAEAHVHAAEVGMELGDVAEEGTAITGSGAALVIAAPLVALGLGMYKLAEANARGHELNTALARDEQRAAMLTNLALPQEFVQGELAKFSHLGKTFAAPMQRMTGQMHGQDHALAAVVQLHCDQGMNAAKSMCEDGASKVAFFVAHPEVAKRYASDVAFQQGFDAMTWAHDKGGATYSNLVNDLDARDARYGAAGVSYRV